MNLRILVGAALIAAISTFAPQQANAKTLQADFSVTNNNSDSLLTSGLPLNTVLTGSLLFDVDDSGPLRGGGLSNFRGSLSWDNGSAQTFSITGPASGGSTHTTGFGRLLFGTTGADFSPRALTQISVFFATDANPFSSSGLLSEFLLTHGSFGGLAFGLQIGDITNFYSFDGDINSSFTEVTAVPLPAGFPLLLVGLSALALLRRRT